MTFIGFLNLLGAIGLFLYGMKVMSDALMSITGHRMRQLMIRLTSNRFKGVLTGLAITGLIQSSSATTLMVVSFVNAQLLTLIEAISVIMGANIGTTLTAWLITLLGFKVKMSAIALPLMILGFALYIRNDEKLHQLGRFIAGFALLFIGLEFMKDAVPDFNESPAIYEFFHAWSDRGFTSVLIFVAIGTALTLILQSSSATMAITLVAASQGLLSFEAAAAIVLGENIGTTITANLAALIGSTQAKRTAVAHFLFNIIGVFWVLLIFDTFLGIVATLSAKVMGAQPMLTPQDIPIGLSIFHSSFNILNTLLLLGFVPQLAKLVEKIIPEKPAIEPEFSKPKYLDDSLLEYPETAIHVLLQESRRLYRESVFEALTHGLNLHREDVTSFNPPLAVVHNSSQTIPIEIESYIGTRVSPIYTAILAYASKMQEKLELSEEQRNIVNRLKQVDREVPEILRNAAIFRREMIRYNDSANAAIKEEFDQLRVRIVILLRSYRHWNPDMSDTERETFLEELKTQAKNQDAQLIVGIDALIRSHTITPEMGASLITASSSILHISKALIRSAHTLSSMGPDYNELEEMLTEKKAA